MTLPGIGILGLGYLGQEIANLAVPKFDLWATRHSLTSPVSHSETPSSTVGFQWDNPATWNNLPKDDSYLILTIPPVLKDVSEEQKRLQNWCRWINQHRPGFRRCLYVSSTGVYPNLPGNWHEQSVFKCDSIKGELRRVSEKILSDHFDTIVVRSGAIYGDDRNIGRRILAGKAIPSGKQPIHRIHVHDLARLILQAIETIEFTALVNAADLESETTRNVADWLTRQSFFPGNNELSIEYRSDFETRKFNLSEPNRKISNQRLVEECKFEFTFPTYKEGLRHAFTT